jgi:hypothetical protein
VRRTGGTGQGFCIKLPSGFKFEKVEGDTTSFADAKYFRISIEHMKDPKGGMLKWSLSSDSKSGKVQSYLEAAKTITLL